MSPLKVSAMLHISPEVHCRAHDSCKGIQYHERHVGTGTKEEFDTSGTVQSPANDGGESEAAHRHSGKDRYPAAIDSGEATDGQLRTGSLTVIYGYATAQDDQRCHGTDDDGVHEYFKDAEEALFYRFLRIGTGMGDGSGTKTGFIGEDTAGYALFFMLMKKLPTTPPVTEAGWKAPSIIEANTAGTDLIWKKITPSASTIYMIAMKGTSLR